MDEKIFQKIKDYILKNYNPTHCAYTVFRSEGNSDDVFNDGSACGKAYELYEIGTMLGMELPEPEEADYDDFY
jgi:hypothetical protein